MRISGNHPSSTHHSAPPEPHGPSGSHHGPSGAHGGKPNDSGMDIPPLGGKSGGGNSEVSQALDQMMIQLGQQMLSSGKKWAAQLKAENNDG
ncbi:hypothetical protein [Pandoraea anhela]|uniref:Uncharacterized protein n=1 Tax=Pandoraea anhela TaxID=2508295 RepID=A0A5E4RSH1_9BURK|nr:hypothetical protein [Pandoraea anhela]VVD66380.1 hypothetical protein PAN31108_00379 [Pandoraea anhela]